VAPGLVAVAVCGGTAAATSSSSGHRPDRMIVGSMWNPGYDFVVVAPNRHALYMFCISGASNCPGHHERDFPPLLAHGRPVASPGSTEPGDSGVVPWSRVRASNLGTVKLKSGQRQVTYSDTRSTSIAGTTRTARTAIHGMSKPRDQWTLIQPTSGHRAISSSY
jgi:hypothetical protein